MAFDYDKWIRPGKLPHIWCPGCGHGIVMKGLIRAMETLQLKKEDTALVSGIGCASRPPMVAVQPLPPVSKWPDPR
jgi:2-oxoglutarate ferredoxin oxidoreductase subunit beta